MTKTLFCMSILLSFFAVVKVSAGEGIYLFKNLQGPTVRTVIAAPVQTSWRTYHQPSISRLAILLTDPDSQWLGLAHGLKAIGVPFFITQDYKEAIKSRVVFVYPIISGRALTPEALRALRAFPTEGGTLLACQVLGGGLKEVFGFQDALPSIAHVELRFDAAQAKKYSLDDPKELTIQLGSSTATTERMGSYTYKGSVSPLAVYEDGSAAITQRAIGRGHAYAFGMDVGAIILKGYENRDEWMERSYVNGFEPTIDVFLRLIKGLYRAGEPNAVTLFSVPDHKALAVLITHDIDYTVSVENAVLYARYEQQQGLPATYFIQTKYIRDYNDDIFFNEKEAPFMKQLRAMGMEVASHSVSHSRVFNAFPLGTGDEQYPTYRPFVQNRQVTRGGSILGELRVSKFLIEQVVGGPPVVSFRPGHLRNPYALPQALEATGYRYSSSATANNSLTHLPFQLNYNREFDTEVSMFEFPVTVEDESPPELLKRLPQTIELAQRLCRYGGSFVILLHPNVLGQKLEFEKQFVQAVKDYSYFGTLSGFGEWWAARNKAEVTVENEKKEPVIHLVLPVTIKGLTLEVPRTWILKSTQPAGLQVSQTLADVVLGPAQGNITLFFMKK